MKSFVTLLHVLMLSNFFYLSLTVWQNKLVRKKSFQAETTHASLFVDDMDIVSLLLTVWQNNLECFSLF
jgi:hypothetical protein